MNKTIEEKLNAGRAYRNFVRQMETREEADGGKIVEGYATVFNTVYELWREPDFIVLEQIAPEAFDGCDMRDVIMQYNHEGRVFARTGNGTLTVTPDEVGLKVIANLGGTELGGQVFEEIAGGYSDKMSFGFVVAEDKREVTEDRENNITTVLRTITRISKLYDVSVVSIPANDATSISARSYGEGVAAELKEEHLKREQQKKRIRILMEATKDEF